MIMLKRIFLSAAFAACATVFSACAGLASPAEPAVKEAKNEKNIL